MSGKCMLLNEKNEVIDYADLCNCSSKVVLIPYDGETLSRFKQNQFLKYQYENEYDKVFSGEIIDICDGKISLNNIRNVRSDVRVIVHFESTISFENKDGYYLVDITVRNISSGGMCFECTEELDMGITYEAVIEWIETPIIVKVKLLRKDMEEKGVYIYGCKFIDLIEEEECLLRAGVYYIQAKKIKPRRRSFDNEVC